MAPFSRKYTRRSTSALTSAPETAPRVPLNEDIFAVVLRHALDHAFTRLLDPTRSPSRSIDAYRSTAASLLFVNHFAFRRVQLVLLDHENRAKEAQRKHHTSVELNKREAEERMAQRRQQPPASADANGMREEDHEKMMNMMRLRELETHVELAYWVVVGMREGLEDVRLGEKQGCGGDETYR